MGLEGAFGRVKPDIVAPGVFVVSARSTQWDSGAYYGPPAGSNNYSAVLSNLNETLGPFYRYESGTSLAAARPSLRDAAWQHWKSGQEKPEKMEAFRETEIWCSTPDFKAF